ncbi:hypothetical protein SAMN05421811_11215 [Nonomuraea wenchangensis]|uniref:Uncharacterized protein n=1 Tax=Nonomuraea wenchangensis TaxID=568860 RepID=A0A1I0L5K3_9ACTN|nr:hypothetical protein SAMN05421811_11215 [Nonomuraea wenchangensis]
MHFADLERGHPLAVAGSSHRYRWDYDTATLHAE